MISYTESIAKLKLKAKKACFGQESFVHSLMYKSMTLYSSGVKGYDQVSVQGLIFYDCEVSGPSTTCAWSV